MPVISFAYSDLVRILGRDIGRESFAETVPMMGCDINRFEGDEVELEFFPNRPDLYSVEGVGRALRAFLGIRTGTPHYNLNDSNIELVVDESVSEVRPFVLCGIARGIALDDATVRSMMEMQEKLHLTVGRHRRKVSIGIHDLDKVKPPFTYKAVEPGSVRFVPLGCDAEMDLRQVLERHEKGIAHASILDGKGAYPVIVDREGSVLSFPPIINGTLTQVTPATQNLFLDVTGTDYLAVSLVLNMVATALVERGARLETVVMRYPKRPPARTPSLPSRKKVFDPENANRLLGTNLNREEMVSALGRMMYDVAPTDGKLEVSIPAFRMDILHEVDIIEDLAIGHSYRKLEGQLPRAMTFGRELAGEFRSERARQALVGLGYVEAMTFVLTSPGEGALFGTEKEGSVLVNPITEEMTTLRVSLLPSLLQLLRLNKHVELPQRLFEVGEVVEEGKNRRHLGAVLAHSRANFTEAKSLAEAAARELGLEGRYIVKPRDRSGFLDGRCASLVMGGSSRDLGWFGEVHPRALEHFELSNPVVGMELDLDGW